MIDAIGFKKDRKCDYKGIFERAINAIPENCFVQ